LLLPVGNADKQLLPPNRRKQLLIHNKRLAHAVSVASLLSISMNDPFPN